MNSPFLLGSVISLGLVSLAWSSDWLHYDEHYGADAEERGVRITVGQEQGQCPELGEHAYKGRLLPGPPLTFEQFFNDLDPVEDHLRIKRETKQKHQDSKHGPKSSPKMKEEGETKKPVIKGKLGVDVGLESSTASLKTAGSNSAGAKEEEEEEEEEEGEEEEGEEGEGEEDEGELGEVEEEEAEAEGEEGETEEVVQPKIVDQSAPQQRNTNPDDEDYIVDITISSKERSQDKSKRTKARAKGSKSRPLNSVA